MAQNELCLVIAGGGVHGAGMLGAIQYLDEVISVKHIKSFLGTSIGAIVGYLICIGYEPLEIIHYTVRHGVLQDLGKFSDDLPHLIFSQYGLISFEPINEFLELLTLSRHGRLFTLQELRDQLGVEFGCVTYNYTKMRIELLHCTTTPDLSCIQAIQMSCSIPYVFTQCTYRKQVYIDGGIIDNFPLKYAFKLTKSPIIGIVTHNADFEPGNELSIATVLSLPVRENTNRSIRKYKKRATIVNIPISTYALDFNLELSTIMEMFSNGYRACKTQYPNKIPE